MSTEHDDLRRQLELLGSAADYTSLPGPAAARARGAQRSRRYAAGAAMSVALVLTGGTFTVAQLSGSPSTLEPATPPADSTVEPSPSPVDAALIEIPAAALMTVDDIVDERYPPSASGFVWTAADEDRPECFPTLGSGVLTDHAQVTYAADNTPADFARHDVYAVEAGAVAAALDLLVEQVSDCQQATTELAGPLSNVGDEGYLVQYLYPGDQITWLVELSLVRRGDVISAVTRWNGGQEYLGEPDVLTPANAAERMCDAVVGEPCVTGDPGFDAQQAPDSAAGARELADDPFLTEDQVNPVGTRERFVQGELSQGIDSPPWDNLCFDDPGELDSVEEMRNRPWNDTFDASLYQTVLRFTDASAADQWLRGYTAIEERCATFNVEDDYGSVTDHGALDLSSGDDALAWSIYYAPPEAGAGFWGAAVARRDNIAVVLAYGAMDGPEGPGDWVEYVTQRLGQALDNAIGGTP